MVLQESQHSISIIISCVILVLDNSILRRRDIRGDARNILGKYVKAISVIGPMIYALFGFTRVRYRNS